MSRIVGTDTLEAGTWSEAYVFEYRYDSAIVQYSFTEIEHNGERLELANWRARELISSGVGIFTDSSHTEPFVAKAGDVIWLFRQVSWYSKNPIPFFGSSNYHSTDTLIWVIELRDSQTNSQVAVIDSMGLYPSLSLGAPSGFGTNDLIDSVHFIIPSSLDGDTLTVGLTLYQMGPDSGYYPVRLSEISGGASRVLTDTAFAYILNNYNLTFPKLLPPADGSIGNTRSVYNLAVSTSAGAPSEFQARIVGSGSDDAPIALALYGVDGRHIFTAYHGSLKDAPATVNFSLDQPGTYFAVLVIDGTIHASAKVIR